MSILSVADAVYHSGGPRGTVRVRGAAAPTVGSIGRPWSNILAQGLLSRAHLLERETGEVK